MVDGVAGDDRDLLAIDVRDHRRRRGLRPDTGAGVQDAELIEVGHRGRQGLGAAVLGVVVGIRNEVEAKVLDDLQIRRIGREREAQVVERRIWQDARLEVGHREIGVLDHVLNRAGIAGA